MDEMQYKLTYKTRGESSPQGKPRVYFSTNATIMMSNILSMPPNKPVKDKVFYSCRNYVLLGQIFENLTGYNVKEFCEREIFDVVGMKDTSLGAPRTGTGRNHLAQTLGTDQAGVISDHVARSLLSANVSTFNAGMFSSAEDMAKLMRVYLREGVTDDGIRIFGEKEMREIAPSPEKRRPRRSPCGSIPRPPKLS